MPPLRAKFHHILSLQYAGFPRATVCLLCLAAVKRLEEVTVRLEAIKAVGRKSGGGGKKERGCSIHLVDV